MNSKQMVEVLKKMGLPHCERSKCMETYRDSGESEAMEQANRYVSAHHSHIEDAKSAAYDLLGINI